MTHANYWRAVALKSNLHTQRLIAMAENMPIDILRVRDDDIPGLVMDGVVDRIIGENVLEEELLNRRAQGEDPALLYPASSEFSAAAAFRWQRRLMKPGTVRSP